MAAVAVIIVAVGVIALVYTSAVSTAPPQMTPENAVHIIAAAQLLTHDLRLTGRPVPQAVTLAQLVDLKYLAPSDAEPFKGTDAAISLVATNDPKKAVLMRVRMPDGNDLVLLGDGSAQEISRDSKEFQ